MEEMQEKMRNLERENSEMKAKNLMNMFNGGSNGGPQNAFGLAGVKPGQNITNLER